MRENAVTEFDSDGKGMTKFGVVTTAKTKAQRLPVLADVMQWCG